MDWSYLAWKKILVGPQDIVWEEDGEIIYGETSPAVHVNVAIVSLCCDELCNMC